jgi:hypothetical protein
MAFSSCIKCGSTSFETAEASPNGSKFKLTFVQCSLCGGVVGVLDYYNIGSLLQTLARKLGVRNIE